MLPRMGLVLVQTRLRCRAIFVSQWYAFVILYVDNYCSILLFEKSYSSDLGLLMSVLPLPIVIKSVTYYEEINCVKCRSRYCIQCIQQCEFCWRVAGAIRSEITRVWAP
jgi:hypothetical protein